MKWLVVVCLVVILNLADGHRWWKNRFWRRRKWGEKYEFQTYNVGLNLPAVGDLDRDTRVSRIIDAVLDSTADVLLLQEVWGDTVLLEICEQARDKFPYCASFLNHDVARLSQRSIDSNSTTNSTTNSTNLCGDGAGLEAFNLCRDNDCPFLPDNPDFNTLCPLRYCNPIVNNDLGISPGCQACAITPSLSFLGNDTAFRDAVNERLQSGACDLDPEDPDGGDGDGEAALTSSRGLLILSRHKIIEKQAIPIVYPSEAPTFSDKAFIVAKIEGIGYVVGTTLTSDNTRFFDYTSSMVAWITINNWELYTLFDYVNNNFDGKRVIIMGGLNSNPPVDGVCPIKAKFERNFLMVKTNGFKSPFLQSRRRQCTLCSNNPLTDAVDDTIVDTMTDHILMPKGCGLRARGKRVLINTLNRKVQVSSEAFSPYYGVSVKIDGFPKKHEEDHEERSADSDEEDEDDDEDDDNEDDDNGENEDENDDSTTAPEEGHVDQDEYSCKPRPRGGFWKWLKSKNRWSNKKWRKIKKLKNKIKNKVKKLKNKIKNNNFGNVKKLKNKIRNKVSKLLSWAW